MIINLIIKNPHKIILNIIGLIILTSASYGQNQLRYQQKEFFDNKYGIDVLLHEGKVFYPEINIASGNPYWGAESINEGSIVLNGKRFDKQRIGYNICLQNFILIYNDFNGAEKQIVFDKDKIDSVFIKGSVFIKNPVSKIKKNFVQLIHEGTISCYVGWEKIKEVKSDIEIKGFSYSKEERINYIIYNSILHRFRNKRELLSIFPVEHRNEIRKFLSKNDIGIKSANTEQLKLLIGYIEKINNKA